MQMYRLYIGHNDQHGMLKFSTESVQEEILTAMLQHDFDGATLQDATGIWKGNLEPTTVVGIAANGISIIRIERLAATIAYVLDQEAVMLEGPDGKVRFVGQEMEVL